MADVNTEPVDETAAGSHIAVYFLDLYILLGF
jgi:hypothetical protein